ncbi:MAG: hypothetical protein RL497_1930 [Pseudomonadota bacterium]|jgi:AcrR family transcriptional regulator
MKTKQKILNAAIQILGDFGYQALTQTRVAEAAGLRQGLLTYHFPTRSDLLKAVVEESKTQITQAMMTSNEPLTITRLQDIVVNSALAKNIPRIMLALTLAGDEDPALAAWFVASDVSTRQHFRALFTHLGFQMDECQLHLLRATVVGASLINLQQNTEASEQVAREVIQLAFQQLLTNLRPL